MSTLIGPGPYTLVVSNKVEKRKSDPVEMESTNKYAHAIPRIFASLIALFVCFLRFCKTLTIVVGIVLLGGVMLIGLVSTASGMQTGDVLAIIHQIFSASVSLSPRSEVSRVQVLVEEIFVINPNLTMKPAFPPLTTSSSVTGISGWGGLP